MSASEGMGFARGAQIGFIIGAIVASATFGVMRALGVPWWYGAIGLVMLSLSNFARAVSP